MANISLNPQNNDMYENEILVLDPLKVLTELIPTAIDRLEHGGLPMSVPGAGQLLYSELDTLVTQVLYSGTAYTVKSHEGGDLILDPGHGSVQEAIDDMLDHLFDGTWSVFLHSAHPTQQHCELPQPLPQALRTALRINGLLNRSEMTFRALLDALGADMEEWSALEDPYAVVHGFAVVRIDPETAEAARWFF